MIVGLPAGISTVHCCVTIRTCACIANNLSLQRLKFRLPDDKGYLLLHLMYASFCVAQVSVILVCLEIKNYTVQKHAIIHYARKLYTLCVHCDFCDFGLILTERVNLYSLKMGKIVWLPKKA